jgi:hypothetical protein
LSTDGNGVVGRSIHVVGVVSRSGPDAGVLGESTQRQGVVGRGGTYGGEFAGPLASIRLTPQATAGKPTTGNHQMGELRCDANGVLWFCTKTGFPGIWKRVTLT